MKIDFWGYLLPVVSCVLFYLSLIGWGWIMTRMVRVQKKCDFGILGAWGLAFSAVIGGIMNLLGIISLSSVRIFLLIGVLTFIAIVLRDWQKQKQNVGTLCRNILQSPMALAAGLLVCGMLFFSLISAGGQGFNTHDDYHAYLVFPYKMLTSGSIGLELFNERRLFGLGGQSFLQAVFLGLADITQMNAMDRGLGWLVVVGLIFGHGRRRGIPLHIMLSLVFLFHCVRFPAVNVSSHVTGSALFYALPLTFLLSRNEKRRTRILLLGFVAAGLISLKNSHIIGCAMLLFFLYLLAEKNTIRDKVIEPAMIALVAMILLLPWMIDMFQSTATILYPILGKGNHGSVYSTYPSVRCGILSLKSLAFVSILLITGSPFFEGLLLILLPVRKNSDDFYLRRIGFAVYTGAFISAVILYISSGAITRYIFPLSFAAALFLIMESFTRHSKDTKPVPLYRHPAVCFLVVLTLLHRGYLPQGIRKYSYSKLSSGFHSSTKERTRNIAKKYASILDVIPPGKPVAARLSGPILFDFNRNPVYVIDTPGSLGPPPGLPCFDTAEKTAAYLRSLSIQYIIYSYRDEAGHAASKYSHRLQWPEKGYLKRVVIQTRYVFAFQTRLMELGRAYKKLYDDGDVFVLDIGKDSFRHDNSNSEPFG